jgi:uncharacterized protein (UPF0335 family)
MADEEKTAKEAIKEQGERVAKITKKGFDLKALLEGRGLRRASITLYLDEELGVELGNAYDEMVQVPGYPMPQRRRKRSGVIGDLDALYEEKAGVEERISKEVLDNASDGKPETAEEADGRHKIHSKYEDVLKSLTEQIENLEERKAELIAELEKTGLVVQLRAVPPVIEKDCRRKAKETLGIQSKNVPEDLMEDMRKTELAHLMTVTIQSIPDIATDTVNDDVTYQDAIDLMDLLPPGQWSRLDEKLYEVQFTDAISRQIESQEDFS